MTGLDPVGCNSEYPSYFLICVPSLNFALYTFPCVFHQPFSKIPRHLSIYLQLYLRAAPLPLTCFKTHTICSTKKILHKHTNFLKVFFITLKRYYRWVDLQVLNKFELDLSTNSSSTENQYSDRRKHACPPIQKYTRRTHVKNIKCKILSSTRRQKHTTSLHRD